MSLNFDTLFGPYQDKVLINYDWVDADSATGYVFYDGFTAVDNTGTTYCLEKSSERYSLFSYNDTGYTYFAYDVSGGGLIKYGDIDFNTGYFKKERTIRGKAILRIPIYLNASSGVDPEITTGYTVVKVRKYNSDTSTETEIVSVQSAVMGTNYRTSSIKRLYVLPVEIPQTVISINECIRITVEVWVDLEEGSWRMQIGHNPQDLACGGFSAGESRLIISMPFKIEAET